MQSCTGPNNDCMCHLTGNWDSAKEYENLRSLRLEANEVTDQITQLDVALVRENMNTIHERMTVLKEKIYTQKVSVSVRGLFGKVSFLFVKKSLT